MAESFRPSRFLQRVPNPDARMPTGKEMAQGIQEYFEKYTLPKLKENARWRERSRRADLRTCGPGMCPKPGDWPSSRSPDLDW